MPTQRRTEISHRGIIVRAYRKAAWFAANIFVWERVLRGRTKISLRALGTSQRWRQTSVVEDVEWTKNISRFRGWSATCPATSGTLHVKRNFTGWKRWEWYLLVCGVKTGFAFNKSRGRRFAVNYQAIKHGRYRKEPRELTDRTFTRDATASRFHAWSTNTPLPSSITPSAILSFSSSTTVKHIPKIASIVTMTGMSRQKLSVFSPNLFESLGYPWYIGASWRAEKFFGLFILSDTLKFTGVRFRLLMHVI